MKRKTLGLGMASILAVGVLSTSAFSTTAFAGNPVGNPGQKGSLLIYPNIRVGNGVDTLITLTNDSAAGTLLKCYYASSDPVATPNTSTAAQLRPIKHFNDFTINITHNQPISWWASDGRAYSNSQKLAGTVAPPFGVFADATRTAGELKCWAITDDGSTQKTHNHLFGTASVFNGNGQANEYTAYAFFSLGAAELATLTPGQMDLNNVDYDACPNILLGNFKASPINGNATRVTLASCNQDLRQAYTPTITKLTWTFFNQDENARTSLHFCADSWYETTFPAAQWPYAQFGGLGTEVGYFRIETTPDTQVCGPSTTKSSYVGVIEESNGAGNFRGTNLTGRGSISAVIKYDVSPPDSSIRVQ